MPPHGIATVRSWSPRHGCGGPFANSACVHACVSCLSAGTKWSPCSGSASLRRMRAPGARKLAPSTAACCRKDRRVGSPQGLPPQHGFGASVTAAFYRRGCGSGRKTPRTGVRNGPRGNDTGMTDRTEPGDDAAVLAQQGRALRALARQLVARDDVDDVVQDTALASLGTPAARHGPWLRGVVRNLAALLRRGERRRRARETEVVR